MVAEPEQMRFYPRPKSRDEVAEWLAWNLALYEENGFGTWYLESVLDEAFAGYCGIRPLVLDGQREVELAWHVKKTDWNRGLATEAALVSKRLGFYQFAVVWSCSWRGSGRARSFAAIPSSEISSSRCSVRSARPITSSPIRAKLGSATTDEASVPVAGCWWS